MILLTRKVRGRSIRGCLYHFSAIRTWTTSSKVPSRFNKKYLTK